MKNFKALLFVSFGLLLLATGSFAHDGEHTCVHDQMDIQMVPGMEHEAHMVHQRLLADWTPIRVKADYTNFAGLDATLADYLQNTLMPAAINWIQQTYKVKRFTTKLTSVPSVTSCNGINFPTTVTGGNSIPDTDLFLVVSYANDPSAWWVARAGACIYDTATGRPYIGTVQYNLAYLKTNEASWHINLGVSLHEIHHVLFFSPTQYPRYSDPATNKKLTNLYGTEIIDNITTYVFYHPKIVAAAQAFFDCPNLTYVRIENEGTSGSVGAHWERRWFGNEFITATTSNRMPVSILTLTLAEVTGWYLPNYAMAELLVHGKGKGCPFVNSSCLSGSPPKAVSSEFCTGAGVQGCDYESTSAGVCSVTKGTLLNPVWDYFGDNATISSDQFTDNCPRQLGYNNRLCGPGGQAMGYSPEYFGSDSACFVSTVGATRYNPPPIMGQCYQYKCLAQDDGTFQLQANVGKEIFTCARDGQQIRTNSTGYGGTLYCPNPTTFCQLKTQSCPKVCGGVGTCTDGVCTCPAGRTGSDCLRNA